MTKTLYFNLLILTKKETQTVTFPRSLNYGKLGLKLKKPVMNIQKTDPDIPVFLCLVFSQSLGNVVRRFPSVINYGGTYNEWSCGLACLPKMLINSITKCTFQSQLREFKLS